MEPSHQPTAYEIICARPAIREVAVEIEEEAPMSHTRRAPIRVRRAAATHPTLPSAHPPTHHHHHIPPAPSPASSSSSSSSSGIPAPWPLMHQLTPLPEDAYSIMSGLSHRTRDFHPSSPSSASSPPSSPAHSFMSGFSHQTMHYHPPSEPSSPSSASMSSKKIF